MQKTVLFLAASFLLTACANNSGSLKTNEVGFGAAKTSSHAATRIEVYRSDNAVQCQGGGISPEAMQRELSGIQVFAARKDELRGVAFPSVCGGATGSINVYTIQQADQAAAEQRGFRVFQANE